jgi:hypothetical protein
MLKLLQQESVTRVALKSNYVCNKHAPVTEKQQLNKIK